MSMELIDADTGRYTCCGNSDDHDGFHATGCPNRPHEDEIAECPHCEQRYDLTGGCDGDKPGCGAQPERGLIGKPSKQRRTPMNSEKIEALARRLFESEPPKPQQPWENLSPETQNYYRKFAENLGTIE